MDKHTREVRRAVIDYMERYPTVKCLFDEAGHRLKIDLIAPNGREAKVSASRLSGDPHAQDNVLRDVKNALKSLNVALQGEDRIMASISQPKPRVLHTLKDIGKATDLAEEIDTTPQPELVKRRGRGGQNAIASDVIAKAQKLRNERVSSERICQLTGMSTASLYKHTRSWKETHPVEATAQASPPHQQAGNGAHPPTAGRRSPKRLTHTEVFKIAAQLSLHCELVEGLAVYADGWDDGVIAAKVSDRCTALQVKEARVDNVGKLESELPKRLTNPDNRQLLRMIEELQGRVALLEDVVTKP